MADLHDKCPECGLIVLAFYIFDAAAKKDEYGPILGIHSDASPETAKAGYVGLSSADQTETYSDWYRCPRCGASVIVSD